MKMRLKEILSDKPQSRKVLCQRLGVSDRHLRRMVEELRLEGYPIVSNSQTSGYWIDYGADLDHYIADAKARAYHLLRQAHMMEGRKQLGGQETWLI